MFTSLSATSVAVDEAAAAPIHHEVMSPPAYSGIGPVEWRVFTKAQPNTLMEGEPVAISRVLRAAWPGLQQPVFSCDADRFVLPTESSHGTVILQRVHDLGAADQQRLLDWLGRDGRRTRLITTSSESLFPRVEDGAFLADLYYRLNAVLLQVS